MRIIVASSIDRPPAAVLSAIPEPRAATPSDSLADVTERLMAEYGGRLSLALISGTVLHCRRDLGDASPEVIERAAAQRLRRATGVRARSLPVRQRR